MVTAAVL